MAKRNRRIDAPISMEEVEAVQAQVEAPEEVVEALTETPEEVVEEAPVEVEAQEEIDIEVLAEVLAEVQEEQVDPSHLFEQSTDLHQEPVAVPAETPFEEDAPKIEEMSGYPLTIKGLLDFAAQVIMTGVSTAELVEAVQKTFLVGSHGSAKSPKAKANPTYTLVNENFGEVKMATQAKAILQVLRDNGGSMSYSELVENLPAYVHTVQTPERLVTFYRGKLQENGFLFIQ